MRRTILLTITGLARSEEEEEMKYMEKEEGMKDRSKEKVKLHCLKIP
jgi:hypothetical protein